MVDGSKILARLSYGAFLLAGYHEASDVWQFELHRFQKFHPRKSRQAQVNNDKVHWMSRNLVHGVYRINSA